MIPLLVEYTLSDRVTNFVVPLLGPSEASVSAVKGTSVGFTVDWVRAMVLADV